MASRSCDKTLLERVKRIAESPAGDDPDVKSQLTTLAKAIKGLSVHCSDLTDVVSALAQSVSSSSR